MTAVSLRSARAPKDPNLTPKLTNGADSSSRPPARSPDDSDDRFGDAAASRQSAKAPRISDRKRTVATSTTSVSTGPASSAVPPSRIAPMKHFTASVQDNDPSSDEPRRPVLSPATAPSPSLVRAQKLLQLEAEVRRLPTRAALFHHSANDAGELLGHPLTFVVKVVGRRPNFQVETATNVPQVDRHSPLLASIEAMLAQTLRQGNEGSPQRWSLADLDLVDDDALAAIPYGHFLWVPFARPGTPATYGWLLCRESPWNEASTLIATRLAETYAHSLRALSAPPLHRSLTLFSNGRAALLLLALIAATGFVPVSMTALAPVEVIAANPAPITPTVGGMVKALHVRPGEPVSKGTALVEFDKTVLANEAELAVRKVDIARTRVQRASQTAIVRVRQGQRSTRASGGRSAPQNNHSLALARSELALAEAELRYANDRLAKTTLRAPRDGIAVFSDPRDWAGKPVSAGEEIMSIADPRELRLRIDLPVADAIVFKTNAPVSAFLDADPLNPLLATTAHSSYHARPDDQGVLSYAVTAEFTTQGVAPRIGAKGTARITGDDVSLFFYLFRRPITAIRQYLGL